MLRQDDVIGAMTGSNGIKMVWQEKPDLVLLDINLPDMDGFEVLKMLRTNPYCKTLPIVAVTANAMHGDKENILSAGFNGYVAKPLTRLELQNAIRLASAAV
jgi:CheY-like chemotaxis protein